MGFGEKHFRFWVTWEKIYWIFHTTSHWRFIISSTTLL